MIYAARAARRLWATLEGLVKTAMISTRDLAKLPDIPSFRRLTRALAMLDAILSPDWQYRYYSFNSRWADGEMMASMRNGSGDHWFALLCPAGVALRGLAHEAPIFRPGSPWPGIFDSLPSDFHANFLYEPAFDGANSTFCVWRRATDDRWSCGPVRLPPGDDPDGSGELLSILTGGPQQYSDFAGCYYGRQVAPTDVAAVYAHRSLTQALIRRINLDVDAESLAGDIEEIGYPET
jgi:hypothetical protein